MNIIARHAIDAERVREGVEGDTELLMRVVDAATNRAAALSIVLSTARSLAGYLSAAGAEASALRHPLHIGAQAAAAIFALASGDGEIEFSLDDRRLRLAATGPTDASHVGNWRIGWWLARIVGDVAAIDTLAATDVELMRRSSSRADECQYRFASALQAFEQRAPDWSDALQQALDATDPERMRLLDEPFVLNVLVPEMQVLFRLALGETAPFEEAFEFALQRHRKYWSKGERVDDPDGYLALGPLALGRLALAAGMPIDVDSDYVPRGLMQDG